MKESVHIYVVLDGVITIFIWSWNIEEPFEMSKVIYNLILMKNILQTHVYKNNIKKEHFGLCIRIN